jgi:hypothetical protein
MYGVGEAGGGSGRRTMSKRRFASASATSGGALPLSALISARSAGSHTACIAREAGIGWASRTCSVNARSEGSSGISTSARTDSMRATRARVCAASRPPSHRARARASGFTAPSLVSIADSTVTHGRIGWPAARMRGSTSTW